MPEDVKVFDPGATKEFQEKRDQPKPEPKKEPEPKPEPKPSLKEKIGKKISAVKEKVSQIKQEGARKYAERKTKMYLVKHPKTRVIAETSLKAAKTVGKKGVEFGKYTGGQFKEGLKEGAKETVSGYGGAIRSTGRFIGSAPYTGARAVYRKTLQPALMRTREGFYRPRGISRHRLGDEGMAYRSIAIRSRGMGRMPRSAVPKGVIKPYWSKKLKKLARQQIRRHGEEEGIARTRQVAQMLGWKMQ